MAIANVSLGATTSASAASKTTITVTPSTAPTNGDSLVVIGSYHTTGTGSFTDNGAPANSYTVQVTRTNTIQVDLGTVLSVAGSPTSITYSNTGAKGHIAITVGEYSGVSAFGTTGSNTGSVSPATVAVTTQDDNDWLVGGGTNNSTGILTAGASTNNRSTDTANIDSWVFDSGAVAAPASTTLSETLGTAAAWATVAVVLRPPLAASGAGTEHGAAGLVASSKISGAGTELGAATFVASSKISGAGTEHGAAGLVASSKISGAGTEHGVATVTASSKISGAGTESSTTAFVRSQAVSGAGTEKATVTAVSGAKSVSASGTEHGSATFVASSKVSGAGTEHGAASLVASSKISGAGTEHGAASLLASQKVSGAGTEKTGVAFSLSQKASGAGTEHGAASLIASSTTSGAGTEHGLASVVSGQKISGSGIEHGAAGLVASSKASGAGTHKTSTSFALSQKTSGIGASKATAVATSAGGKPTASVTVTMKAAATVSTAGTSVGLFWGPVGPQTPAVGCLWMNSGAQTLFMWNGQIWIKKV